MIGGVTAAAFYGVGSAFPSASKIRGMAPWEKGRLWFGKIVAHGTVGGASSAAQGGSFQDGFRSSGFTQLASPVIGAAPGGSVGRTIAASIVGGTASKLGGGKFANGAVTFGFVRLFSEVGNYATGETDRLKRLACSSSAGQVCAVDERGVLRADGTRGVDWGLNPSQKGNWLTNAGMAPEGSGLHLYDPGGLLGNRYLRYFVTDVAKIHDWLNSWNYNQANGLYVSRGAAFDSAFQLYSFAGMPISAVATVGRYAGNAPFSQQNTLLQGVK